MTSGRYLKKIVANIQKGVNSSFTIDGVCIQKVDEYGYTETQRKLAATELLLASCRAERDKPRAQK